MLKLRNLFSDIGEVKHSTISDGTNNFDCEVIDLEKALLIKVNEAFYLDDKVDLKRLDKNDLKLYNIDRYFEVDEPKVEVVKKRRAKK